MTAVKPDREWMLAAARGDIDTEAALHQVRVMRYFPDAVDDEMAAALAEGDRQHPDDKRRWPETDTPPWETDVDVDPATMAAFEDAVSDAVELKANEGSFVLDELATFLARFVAFPSPAALDAVALWAAHTHMVKAFESTPRLAVLSPEPGSGKTRVLEVLELLVPRPQHVLNASVAAIFRVIAASSPTLLFDEVDAVFNRRGKGDDSSEDLRGLLNAGHRRSATIPRCVGPTHAVEHFPVYAACALAGLGDLPDTLMTRSVVIRMRRRAPGERVESFRRRVAEPQGHEIRDYLAEWAERAADACGDAWPEMPPGVTDRPADVWEGLLAIADAAGGDWPTRARAACVELTNARATEDTSLGVRLLSDIRGVFKHGDEIKTTDLIEALAGLEEAPWGDWYGKPIDARWLAKHLKPYAIAPTQIRIGGGKIRGYRRSDFTDAWTRYLPSPDGSGTGEADGTSQVTATRDVPPVPDVPASQEPSEGGRS